ncbi:MerR family transcriptional regulator [Streptomyces sp. NRRL B-1347]|uniref:MerR family transcriptional regulator n=1 Tax=Streptomyces sp. NRRL B-1347 TaxID=1476877 RepID=UPI0004C7C556|nr:MerR family transcriptional regulator [Streptomyces sp. NRRL B-1347]
MTSERALRPIDLARLAGVSTQLIRDYADAGVLPPTERTPSGYRRFHPVHARALLTYRALARGFGAETARGIMRAVHAADVPAALALVDAAHAELHARREALRATAEALAAVADEPLAGGSEPRTRSPLTVSEAAAQVGVRPSALRVWESAGLLAPARERGTRYRRYGAADLRDARMISLLRQARYPLAQIRPVLEDLRETGGSEALRAALDRRTRDLTRTSRATLEGASRLHAYVTDGEAPA